MKHNSKHTISFMGFSLPELVISIAIISLITSVMAFSQSKFNASVRLTNIAHEIAIMIRDVQSRANNVNIVSTLSKDGYGVSIEPSGRFIVYVDGAGVYSRPNQKLERDLSGAIIASGVDVVKNDLSYTLPAEFQIDSVCFYLIDSSPKICTSSFTALDIAFLRPQFKSYISVSGFVIPTASVLPPQIRRVEIKLKHQSINGMQSVFIEHTGQMYTRASQ